MLLTLEVQLCDQSTGYVKEMRALETMAKYSRSECLNHAVVQRFLDQKWSLRARKWYLFVLFIYTIFLVSLTVYITMVTESKYEESKCFKVYRTEYIHQQKVFYLNDTCMRYAFSSTAYAIGARNFLSSSHPILYIQYVHHSKFSSKPFLLEMYLCFYL